MLDAWRVVLGPFCFKTGRFLVIRNIEKKIVRLSRAQLFIYGLKTTVMIFDFTPGGGDNVKNLKLGIFLFNCEVIGSGTFLLT